MSMQDFVNYTGPEEGKRVDGIQGLSRLLLGIDISHRVLELSILNHDGEFRAKTATESVQKVRNEVVQMLEQKSKELLVKLRKKNIAAAKKDQKVWSTSRKVQMK